MADFITTNAISLVGLLGGLLVACVFLLYVSIARQVRRRDAFGRLLVLVEDEGRYACDAATSRFVHDLNNLILVLSMESERLEGSAGDVPDVLPQIEVLQQVIAEGKDLVKRCRAQTSPVESSSSNFCDELRAATELFADASYSFVDIAVARTVTRSATVPRPAKDVHLLALAMVRAAQVPGSRDRLSLTVSTGRDASLPDDACDASWINVSIVTREFLPEDDVRLAGLSRAARRLSGEVAPPDQEAGRNRLAVSVPVVEG